MEPITVVSAAKTYVENSALIDNLSKDYDIQNELKKSEN